MNEMVQLLEPKKKNIRRRERRAHQRFPCDLPAQMTTSLAPEPFLVHILDEAKDGFGLRVPLFLSSGAIVSIHLPYSIVEAEVRYCVNVGNEFGVGVSVLRILTKQ